MPRSMREFVQFTTGPVTAGLCLVAAVACLSLNGSVHAGAASREQGREFEDFLKLSTADDLVCINLVSIRSEQTKTSVAVCMTFNGVAPVNYRILAIDADGKKHEATGSSGGGGAAGLSAVTVVSHFDVPKERIKSILIQRATRQ
jgi:hypothetical protein